MDLYQNTTWTTREGVVLPIAQMDAEHAANAYRMLQRQARSLAMTAIIGLTGNNFSEDTRLSLESLQTKIFDRPMEWLISTPLMKALAVRAGLATGIFEEVDLGRDRGHLAAVYGLSLKERQKALAAVDKANAKARKLGFASFEDMASQVAEMNSIEEERQYEEELAEIIYNG